MGGPQPHSPSASRPTNFWSPSAAQPAIASINFSRLRSHTCTRPSSAPPSDTVSIAAAGSSPGWSEWEDVTNRSGRCQGTKFVLPEWFDQGVLDRRVVLAIGPASFALLRGIERWLYRVARKRAVRHQDGWRCEFRRLHAKSVSLAPFSDLALDTRQIVARQPLPRYALEGYGDGRELIVVRPTPSRGRADKLRLPPAASETSGATDIGISSTSISELRSHKSRPSLSCAESSAPKDAKSECQFLVLEEVPSAEKPRDGAAHRRGRAP